MTRLTHLQRREMFAAARGVAASAVLVTIAGFAFGRDPSEAYPLFALLTALIAWHDGRGAATLSLGFSTIALATFVLDGPGIAVSDPHQAAGLGILVFACAALIRFAHDLGRGRLEAGTRLIEMERENHVMRKAAADDAERMEELGHRVRNDLSTLASLASLQASGMAGDAGEGLRSMADRIAVLGRVYQRLDTPTGGDATVDVAHFVSGLADDLRTAHLNLRPIALDVHASNIIMPIRTAVVVGLVLNEAITNAIKYAFPDDMDGTISISVHRAPDGMVELVVEDDGCGDEAPVVRSAGSGMGTRLMRAFASRLKGSYRRERVQGRTTVTLRFPME